MHKHIDPSKYTVTETGNVLKKREGREKMHRHIIHKLDKKTKRIRPVHEMGVKTMGQAARRLEILDKVLQLFGMRVGAYQTADLDIQGDAIMGVRLTVYFVR